MRIGLFGGCFNPIHSHHLKIAEKARNACNLDEVWFIPVFKPVHKQDHDLLPYETRLELLTAAVESDHRLRVSEVEKTLGGPSYTIETVRHLQTAFPDHDFTLIIGSDSLYDLPNWKEAGNLMAQIPFAIVPRPQFTEKLDLPNTRSEWLPIDSDEISSSTIRDSLSKGRLKGLKIPARVAALIVKKDLYGCMSGKFRKWLDILKDKSGSLDKKLINHIENTALLAAEFSAAFGEDPRYGFLAGYAHDLFRLSAPEVILGMVRRAGIITKPVETHFPMLAHGAAAAAFLQTLTPRIPSSIIRAVRWHTFPRSKAGKLSKALVIGDALDPSRRDPELGKIRNSPSPPDEKYRTIAAIKKRKAEQRNAHG